MNHPLSLILKRMHWVYKRLPNVCKKSLYYPAICPLSNNTSSHTRSVSIIWKMGRVITSAFLSIILIMSYQLSTAQLYLLFKLTFWITVHSCWVYPPPQYSIFEKVGTVLSTTIDHNSLSRYNENLLLLKVCDIYRIWKTVPVSKYGKHLT